MNSTKIFPLTAASKHARPVGGAKVSIKAETDACEGGNVAQWGGIKLQTF